MTKAGAIDGFFNSFGLKAYEENSVPSDAKYPYITYGLTTDSFGASVPLSASLWYRDSSWTAANAKTEEITKRLSRGGITVPCDSGAIWLTCGTPFAQSMGDPTDNMIKRKLINIQAEFLTA